MALRLYTYQIIIIIFAYFFIFWYTMLSKNVNKFIWFSGFQPMASITIVKSHIFTHYSIFINKYYQMYIQILK